MGPYSPLTWFSFNPQSLNLFAIAESEVRDIAKDVNLIQRFLKQFFKLEPARASVVLSAYWLNLISLLLTINMPLIFFLLVISSAIMSTERMNK